MGKGLFQAICGKSEPFKWQRFGTLKVLYIVQGDAVIVGRSVSSNYFKCLR